MAMTSTPFEATVGSGELPAGQDATGRLWDVLMCMKNAIHKLPQGSSRRSDAEPDGDRTFFDVGVFDGQRHNLIKLWALCGPGDEGEPVVTVMLEGED